MEFQLGGSFHERVYPQINQELLQFLAELIVMNSEANLEISDSQFAYVPKGAPIE